MSGSDVSRVEIQFKGQTTADGRDLSVSLDRLLRTGAVSRKLESLFKARPETARKLPEDQFGNPDDRVNN
jgi:hypothetical protein